jgi:phosphoribosyl-AMP cyclohydrolase
VPAIVQDEGTGEVLMMAWMNAESLRRTLDEGARVLEPLPSGVWRKGDTSGDRQWVREAYYDCDGDTLLFGSSRRARAPATPASTPASSGRSGDEA